MSPSVQIDKYELELEVYETEFVLLKKTQASQSLTSLAQQIYQNQYDFVEEVIGTESEICLKLNKHFNTSSLEQLKDLKLIASPKTTTYHLPVLFSENEDWAAIELASGMSRKTYLAKLLNQEFSLAMLGFLPGFLYLNGLPQKMAIPRKTTPAQRVKAGSIAIGGQYLGFYSLPSPGGWQVVGHSPIRILDNAVLPPVSINPGDRIILQTITEKTYHALLNNPLSLIEYNELL